MNSGYLSRGIDYYESVTKIGFVPVPQKLCGWMVKENASCLSGLGTIGVNKKEFGWWIPVNLEESNK